MPSKFLPKFLSKPKRNEKDVNQVAKYLFFDPVFFMWTLPFFTHRGRLSFKNETASANISPTELQVAPEAFIRPREPEKLLSAWL